jgi:N-methylhydantoinase B
MSGMYDRLKFAAQGLLGGEAGAAGSFVLSDGRQANPKELLFHPSSTRVDTALPGGGGYGHPFERQPSAVLDDVLNGYVTIDAAARDYGVAIRCTRRADEQISMPEHFSVDPVATVTLRSANARSAPDRSRPG